MSSIDYSQTSSCMVNGVETSITLEYAVTEPYAVTMIVSDVPWMFSRDLILDAKLEEWLGEGDVRTAIDLHAGVLYIAVRANRTEEWFPISVSVDLIQQFVSAICRLVRPGKEHMDIDWEKELLS